MCSITCPSGGGKVNQRTTTPAQPHILRIAEAVADYCAIPNIPDRDTVECARHDCDMVRRMTNVLLQIMQLSSNVARLTPLSRERSAEHPSAFTASS